MCFVLKSADTVIMTWEHCCVFFELIRGVVVCEVSWTAPEAALICSSLMMRLQQQQASLNDAFSLLKLKKALKNLCACCDLSSNSVQVPKCLKVLLHYKGILGNFQSQMYWKSTTKCTLSSRILGPMAPIFTCHLFLRPKKRNQNKVGSKK